jgi:purine-binding chemotaxis protein CheW
LNSNNLSTSQDIEHKGIDTKDTHEDHNILRIRAKELAKPIKSTSGTHEDLSVLVFSLSGERYAVEMKYVREVSFLSSLTTLPGTPDFLLGIISLRGRIVSVTDLRLFFNLQRKGLSDYNKIILLSNNKMEFAVLADQVDGMQIRDRTQLSDPPLTINGIGKEYLLGIFPGPIIMINAKVILDDPKLIISG